MGREIAFFDLDNTLWYIHSDIWIIDKNKPEVPILKISPIDFALIKSGIYIKDNYPIEYNGETFYISNDIYEKLGRKIRYPKLSKFGISYSEFFDEEILNKNEVKLLLHNIKHLIGKDVEIGVITARSDRRRHAPLLNKLREKLAEHGFSIDKIYFVSESIRMVGLTGKITYNKNKVLLEHMLGLTIKDDHFIPIKKDMYDKVYFYDDVRQNIMSTNAIQEYFDTLVRKSDDEVVEYINERLKIHPQLITNLVSNNDANPFETHIITLRTPTKFPIQMDKITTKFENFKKS